MQTIELNTPLIEKSISGLKAGDKVLLSGPIFVARDQAHIRLIDMIKKELELPVDLKNQVVYYAGPSPTKPGEVIGSIGPTTSARMDTISEPLFKQGLKITIGKGVRSDAFKELVKKYKAPYLAAMGGGGAVMQESVVESELIAFEDLGPEAIYRLTVKNMPLYVAYDIFGGDIYN
ncbi:fumarate hydratase C-terminal domain-containing protein [Candidatus Peregrinibacteria bacterium]|nr:fumarate hydratase C-terminal domain-containing protein [Candidatus Peregrinibacteria bacterium]